MFGGIIGMFFGAAMKNPSLNYTGWWLTYRSEK
jgi:hypothetical protein